MFAYPGLGVAETPTRIICRKFPALTSSGRRVCLDPQRVDHYLGISRSQLAIAEILLWRFHPRNWTVYGRLGGGGVCVCGEGESSLIMRDNLPPPLFTCPGVGSPWFLTRNFAYCLGDNSNQCSLKCHSSGGATPPLSVYRRLSPNMSQSPRIKYQRSL